MTYDFTSIIDRHGKDALCVDGLGLIPGKAPQPPLEGFDVIPMWIADMNFKTVPTVVDALTQRVQHALYGYFMPTDDYYDSIIRWQYYHHQVTDLEKQHIGYENGVLGGVVSTLTSFASAGDAVLLHSPTYTGFSMILKNNGFKPIHSELVKDEQGIYRMNLEDMERRIVEHHIHVAIFCSPHNPTGRVWEREEIEQAMLIFKKHEVIVISDEIWSDIILPGNKHIPTQSVSDDAKNRTVAMYAPSKTFNLAGLVGSYHIIYNDYLRDRVMSISSKSHYNEMNVLSMHALIGAYQPEGYEWLDALRSVLEDNITYAVNFIHENFEGVSVTKPEGTYMLFIDCHDYLKKNGITLEELEKRGWNVGVAWQDGSIFNGQTHIRLNLALPYCKVVEAFDRLKRYVFI